MKPSSAKQKGRRACLELQEKLLSWAPDLTCDDIRVTASGSNGEDILFSQAAKKKFPFAFEVKNQESLNVWSAFAQAEAHAKGSEQIPCLAYRRNRSDLMVTLKLDDFLKLIC